jgi:hypothetical protein
LPTILITCSSSPLSSHLSQLATSTILIMHSSSPLS